MYVRGDLAQCDAVDHSLSFGHWDWVLGMDQLLLQGLERVGWYPDAKSAEDPPDGLWQATNIGEGQSPLFNVLHDQVGHYHWHRGSHPRTSPSVQKKGVIYRIPCVVNAPAHTLGRLGDTEPVPARALICRAVTKRDVTASAVAEHVFGAGHQVNLSMA